MGISTLAITVCGLLVITCCTMAEEVKGKPMGSLVTYEAMVEASAGPHAKVMLMISKNFYYCGLIVVYIILEAKSLSTWIPWTEELITFAIVLPIFLAMAMLRDLTMVVKLNCVGITAALLQTLCMEIGALLELRESTPDTYNLISSKVENLGASTASFVFAYGSVAALPSIRGQMQKPEDLPNAFIAGMVIVCLVYMSVMFIGYFSLGNGVADDMIDDITKHCTGFQCIMGSGAAGSIVVNLFISSPTFMYVVISTFEASGSSPIHTPLTLPNAAVRVTLIGTLTVISVVVPYVKQIIGLISAVFGVCNIIVFPMLCAYTLKRTTGRMTEIGREARCVALTPFFHVVVSVIGFITLVFGAYGGVMQLKSKIENAN